MYKGTHLFAITILNTGFWTWSLFLRITESSANYGNLTIAEEGVFYWTGYEALSPFTIPPGAENAGKLTIKYFVSKKIKKETSYIGVLSFQFYSLKDSIDFMYGMKDDSLILEVVEEKNIEDGIVIRRENPPILYFEKV